MVGCPGGRLAEISRAGREADKGTSEGRLAEISRADREADKGTPEGRLAEISTRKSHPRAPQFSRWHRKDD